MAITEERKSEHIPVRQFEYEESEKQKKTTFGIGLIKGLGVTLRHLFSRSVTIHYPDERPNLPPRSRGVIALKEENCTVCMLCARECPDWCIYIEGHKEERRPKQEGKRAKKYNVLDRFAIDYALCMYCGICVEVCPYDALFWTPEFEYSEHDITLLTHEMEKLSDWMYTVLPPPPLDDGARGPVFKTAVAAAPKAAAPAAVPAPAAPKAAAPTPAAAPTTPKAEPAGAAKDEPTAGGAVAPPRTEEGEPAPPEEEEKVTAEAAEALETDVATGEAAEQEPAPQPEQEAPTPAADQPQATPAAQEPSAGVSAEEAAEIRKKVLEEELAKGSDPRVAEGRAKAAELRATKGTKGPE
jgi:formate hydrogenlyase subunit 6/NADH:ubiquinone oxidoreductase subunit I